VCQFFDGGEGAAANPCQGETFNEIVRKYVCGLETSAVMKRVLDVVNVLISVVLIGFIALSLFRIGSYLFQTYVL
jgi:hypothetical protein